jgi:NAD(P)-dependent dehydrogenase (short-subunit alcohol dehydrogenase family)
MQRYGPSQRHRTANVPVVRTGQGETCEARGVPRSRASPSLHALVNDVGGATLPGARRADGYEATLAMNLVGAFALSRELLPLRREGALARECNGCSSPERVSPVP